MSNKKRYKVSEILNNDYLLEGLDIEEQIYISKQEIDTKLDYSDIVYLFKNKWHKEN